MAKLKDAARSVDANRTYLESRYDGMSRGAAIEKAELVRAHGTAHVAATAQASDPSPGGDAKSAFDAATLQSSRWAKRCRRGGFVAPQQLQLQNTKAYVVANYQEPGHRDLAPGFATAEQTRSSSLITSPRHVSFSSTASRGGQIIQTDGAQDRRTEISGLASPNTTPSPQYNPTRTLHKNRRIALLSSRSPSSTYSVGHHAATSINSASTSTTTSPRPYKPALPQIDGPQDLRPSSRKALNALEAQRAAIEREASTAEREGRLAAAMAQLSLRRAQYGDQSASVRYAERRDGHLAREQEARRRAEEAEGTAGLMQSEAERRRELERRGWRERVVRKVGRDGR